MADERLDLETRRRAIYTALRARLDEQESRAGVCLWQKRYRTEPTFALRQFTLDLCEQLGRKYLRGDLHRRLLHALFQPPEDLLPDPEVESDCRYLLAQLDSRQLGNGAAAPEPPDEASADATPSASPPAEPASPPSRDTEAVPNDRHTLFQRLLGDLRHALAGIDPAAQEAALRDFAQDVVRQDEIPVEDSSAIAQWIFNPQLRLTVQLTEAAQQRVIHLLYRRACEHLGPAQTDRTYADVVRRLEERPIDDGFTVRRWL